MRQREIIGLAALTAILVVCAWFVFSRWGTGVEHNHPFTMALWIVVAGLGAGGGVYFRCRF